MEEQTKKSPLSGFFKYAGLTLLSAVLFYAVVSYAGFVVTPKNNGPDDGVIKGRCMSIFAEPENSLDVVFVGDSLFGESVNPFLMYERAGFTSYNASYNGQRSYSAVCLLDKISQKQTPQVVVLDADILFSHEQPAYTIFQLLDDYFPVAEYHQRWKDVTLKDFYTPVNYTYLDKTKGHIIREKITYSESAGYMDRGDDYISCGMVSEVCLKMFKDKCDEIGVQLLVVSVPSAKDWMRGKAACMEQMSQKYGFTFIDMNQDDSLGIDWTEDSRDSGIHMNWKGSKKVTLAMMRILQAHCATLPDHRGDAAYQQAWDDQLANYHQMLEDAKRGERVM